MIQQWLIRLLLAPVSVLYGLGVSLRNFFYRKGLLKGVEFDVPIISVGNLSVGGAGKTPHIEYLIRLLRPYINVATLSRGYKRKTKGFRLIRQGDSAVEAGDEPLQFRRKFQGILVSVAENRAFAIPQIMMEAPTTQVILLDDAFQHRSVRPGLNILLTDYRQPFTRDWLLPSGRLREWRSAYHRADLLIVTKCPPVMEKAEADQLRRELNLYDHQQLFFSYYQYLNPYFIWQHSFQLQLRPEMEVLLICAIAGTEYLVEFLETRVSQVRALEYEDHHMFSKHDIANLLRTFEHIDSKNKVILTTEKDAMRMELHRDYLLQHRLPIFVLPVQVAFHFSESPAFNDTIKNFLLNFKS